MRTSFLCHHRLPRICQKDDARPTQISEHRAQGGDRSNPCVDTEVLYTGTMASTGTWHCGTGEGDDGRSCDGNLSLGGIVKHGCRGSDGRGGDGYGIAATGA